jgi:hypothetical protein
MTNMSTCVRACLIEAHASDKAITIGSELYPEFNGLGVVAIYQRRRRGWIYYCELSSGERD